MFRRWPQWLLTELLGAGFLISCLSYSATAGIEPDNTSEVVFAYEGPGPVTLLVHPDGSGPDFTAARTEWGETVDVSITLILRDNLDDPIAGYPAEDLYLVSEDGGLVLCNGGSIADRNTDSLGMTQWTQPLAAGGASQAEAVVMANGSPVWALESRVPLQFNSPDMNGDLVVNLSDLQQFAVAFFESRNNHSSDFRADFQRDGQINLADLARFAPAFGTACP